eukprot:6322003-Heterocapsa_arctica.AAC.1
MEANASPLAEETLHKGYQPDPGSLRVFKGNSDTNPALDRAALRDSRDYGAAQACPYLACHDGPAS